MKKTGLTAEEKELLYDYVEELMKDDEQEGESESAEKHRILLKKIDAL